MAYLDDGSDQGVIWRNSEFDDSHWKKGVGKFGYGGDGEKTLIGFGPDEKNKFITSYYRRSFSFADSADASIDSLRISILCDDGAVVYLNGNEVVRCNLPKAIPIGFQVEALSNLGTGQERRYLEFRVPAAFLDDQDHTLAVELHQGSKTSSDAGFDLELHGIRPNKVSVSLKDGQQLKARVLADGSWSALMSSP